MASLELLSFDRPESATGLWVLAFKLPASALDASPSVDISATCIRVESANGETASASLPDGCEPIDEAQASCKLQRKKGLLTVSWPAAPCAAAAESSSTPAPAAGPTEAERSSDKSPSDAPAPKASTEVAVAQKKPAASATAPQNKVAARVSSDYSRFDKIGDEAKKPVVPLSKQFPEAPPPPLASAPAAAPKRSAALDYSKFDKISEGDATTPMVDLENLWRQQSQLQAMRGETADGFAEWQRRRAKSSDTSGEEAFSRGLWTRTNMEDTFAAEAKRAAGEEPTDNDLPALPKPDLLSAMAVAPGVQVLDVAKWARVALREELVKACATDRCVGGKDASIRVDAIIYAVDIGAGSAGIVVDSQTFLCAYQFALKVSFCVATSERPVENGPSPENKYMGDMEVESLASGYAPQGAGYQEALTQCMKTSMREPKPPKRHMSVMRPVLARLELSLAHFVRRFERRFIAYPSIAIQQKAS